jgi:hypothetical protein
LTGAERIAKAFHDAYERLAPGHGYRTREESAKPWAEVPATNRALMIATVTTLIYEGFIVDPSGEPPVKP